jgi:hypothetical protein
MENGFGNVRRSKITRKLEELFDLPPSSNSADGNSLLNIDETQAAIMSIDQTLDKIDAALPAVRDLEQSDTELDEIAELAKTSYQDLSDLAFNVDSRYASELFAVASTMLGHALTAKTTKLNKKLKVLELQMKKFKLDQDVAKHSDEEPTQTAHGQVLSRNDLLEMIKSSKDQKDK